MSTCWRWTRFPENQELCLFIVWPRIAIMQCCMSCLAPFSLSHCILVKHLLLSLARVVCLLTRTNAFESAPMFLLLLFFDLVFCLFHCYCKTFTTCSGEQWILFHNLTTLNPGRKSSQCTLVPSSKMVQVIARDTCIHWIMTETLGIIIKIEVV